MKRFSNFLAPLLTVFVLTSACGDEVDFELVVTLGVDFDALTEGLFPPGDFSVTEPGGVTIPLAVERMIDISETNSEASGVLENGGISEVLDVQVRVGSDTANTDLSELRVALANANHTDPATSELAGIIPLVRGPGTDPTFEWLPNGSAWLEHFVETGTFKVYLLGYIELSEGDRIPYGATSIEIHWNIRAQQ